MPAAALTSVVFNEVLIYAMVVMLVDDSSSGALLLNFVPIQLLRALVPVVIGVGVVHSVRGRRGPTKDLAA